MSDTRTRRSDTEARRFEGRDVWRLWMFAPTNRGGDLLLEPVFSAQHSFDRDLQIALERRARGEVGRILVQTPTTTEER